MIVVGGSYGETVLYPRAEHDFVGSGVRAAAALGPSAEMLLTIATSAEAEQVRTRIPDTPVATVARDRTVEFQYLDAALPPRVEGLPAALATELRCSHPLADVLAFGLAELPSGYPITARRIVLDPQAPLTASMDILDQLTADRIAVCANRKEAFRMTGRGSPIDAAAELLASRNVEAVVVKCGALGYVVADSSGSEWHHAIPTMAVRTLGSGDLFSSIFAEAWFGGASTRDAAASASAAVARAMQVSTEPVSAASLPLPPGYAPKVYLAGPFFTLGERWLVERVRAALTGLGARVFSPIHDVGPGDIEVAQKDLDGLDQCDVVFCLLDGFDPGTIYESGWAARENIPVVGFTSEPHPKETKMLVGMGAEMHTDLTTAMFRAIWAGQGLSLTAGVHTGARHE